MSDVKTIKGVVKETGIWNDSKQAQHFNIILENNLDAANKEIKYSGFGGVPDGVVTGVHVMIDYVLTDKGYYNVASDFKTKTPKVTVMSKPEVEPAAESTPSGLGNYREDRTAMLQACIEDAANAWSGAFELDAGILDETDREAIQKLATSLYPEEGRK